MRFVWPIAALAACTSAPAMVAIDQDWTDITSDPDLGALNSPYQQPVDFGIWQASDGSWHIWECIRNTLVSGQHRLFYQWSAPAPLGPWTPNGIAMMADPSVGETEGGLQAPYVFHDDVGYRMFYGGWTSICSQTSTDGIDFARVLDQSGKCPLVSEASDMVNPRDPMVLRVNGEWNLFYTGAELESDGSVTGRVFVRTSMDLVTWSDKVTVAYGGAAGTIGTSTECPFVVHRSDGYYLFRTQAYGAVPTTDVYRSGDPHDFGVGDDRYRIGTLPVAAPELFDFEGKSYIAALKLDTQGIRIATVRWPE